MVARQVLGSGGLREQRVEWTLHDCIGDWRRSRLGEWGEWIVSIDHENILMIISLSVHVH